MGIAETAEMAVRIGLEDKLSPGLRKMQGNLSKFEGSTRQIGSGVGRLAGGLAKVGVIAAGAAATGLGVAVKWAGDFQAQLNTINTIAQTTPDRLNAIGDGIRKIARDTGITTDELTSSYYDLLSAGVKAADAQAVLNDAVTLGIGALGTTKETVDLLTTAYNAYGLDAKGAAVATDQFAQAVNDGKVTASQIAASFADVASVAKTAGIGIDQIAAAFGDLTAQGVPAAEVTTEMNRAIIELLKPNKALIGLQKEVGRNYAELARKKGLVPALEQMRIDAEKTKTPFQELFGRLEGYKFALQTTGPEFKKFMEEQARIIGSSGEAAKQAAERQQGFNYSLSVLTANVKDAGITIGSYLLPPLGRLAQKAAAFLRRDDIQKKLKDLGAGLAKAIDGIDFDKLVTTASGFANALEPALKTLLTIAQLVAKLPPQLLGAGAGIIVTDKITGGAISGGLGSIVGGLGGALAKSLAASIPIFGKAFVQPVFVTNLGAGGIGGGGGGSGAGAGGGAASFLSSAAIGGALFAVGDRVTKGVEDAIISALPTAMQATVAQGAQGSRTQAFGGVEGALNFVSDPTGSINKMTNAVDQLSGFINSPHPDFLGDLGKLAFLQYQKPPTGPQFMQQGHDNSEKNLPSSAAVLKNLGNIGIDLKAVAKNRTTSLAIQGMRDRLATLLRQETAATKAGHGRVAAQIAAKAAALQARINAAAARQVAATHSAEAKTAGQLGQSNRHLSAIQAKKTSFHVTVPVTTSVSISAINNTAKVHKAFTSMGVTVGAR